MRIGQIIRRQTRSGGFGAPDVVNWCERKVRKLRTRLDGATPSLSTSSDYQWDSTEIPGGGIQVEEVSTPVENSGSMAAPNTVVAVRIAADILIAGSSAWAAATAVVEPSCSSLESISFRMCTSNNLRSADTD
jgi:hypothetical protein